MDEQHRDKEKVKTRDELLGHIGNSAHVKNRKDNLGKARHSIARESRNALKVSAKDVFKIDFELLLIIIRLL